MDFETYYHNSNLQDTDYTISRNGNDLGYPQINYGGPYDAFGSEVPKYEPGGFCSFFLDVIIERVTS